MMTAELSLGATPDFSGVHFAVWSDKASQISVVIYSPDGQPCAEIALTRSDASHTFHERVEGLRPGTLYDFKVDGRLAVDPYARSLPFGVHGPAQVVAPLRPLSHPKRRIDFEASEACYELHVGTFTQEGTFSSATRRLRELRDLGITVIELMPIAAFAGARGWGYDGVGLFAPFSGYGTPEDLRDFLDAAHAHGLSVILDVVYNHLGPAGNSLPSFSDAYFDELRKNAWGLAPALEKPAFRRLILANAQYWLSGFGFDGLRLDATHELEPGGAPHILHALSDLAHACSPRAVLVAEDSRNDPQFLFSLGVDAVWSDDFHHAAHVLLTSETDGYYAAFKGELAELARVSERGQLYEGQPDKHGRVRGKPVPEVPRGRFIFALQNHDQVGNRAHGERLHALCGLETSLAASLLLLFLPATPLLFMGEEWASSAPFLYFTDHAEPLGSAVIHGRRSEFAHFAAFRAAPDTIPSPQAEASFLRSKLDWSERSHGDHEKTLRLYRAALELRQTDAVLSRSTEFSTGVSGSVLWAVRANHDGERLLLLNLGAAHTMSEMAGRFARDARLLLSTHLPDRPCSSFELSAHSASIFAFDRHPSPPR